MKKRRRKMRTKEAEEDEKEEKGEKNEIKMENFHKIESNKEKRIMEDLYCSKSKMNIIDVSYKKEDIKF